MVGAVEGNSVGCECNATAAVVQRQQYDLTPRHAHTEDVRIAPWMQRLPLKYEHTRCRAPS